MPLIWSFFFYFELFISRLENWNIFLSFFSKTCLLVFYCGNYYSRVRVLSVSEYDTFDENKSEL